MTEREPKPYSNTFAEVLDIAMSDPNYLVGTQQDPEYDFSNWKGQDFSRWKDWVVAQKFFSIPTLSHGDLDLRIIKTDPKQFHLTVNGQQTPASYFIESINSKQFPQIFIGTNPDTGEEVVIRRTVSDIPKNYITKPFQKLAQELGTIEGGSRLSSNEDADNWAIFLKEVIKNKKFYPTEFELADDLVREELEMDSDEIITEEDRSLAELQIIQQELLIYAMADIIVST